MKNKVYNIILSILIILLITTLILIVVKYKNNRINENNVKEVIKDVKSQIEDNIKKGNLHSHKIISQYGGYNVVGIISIPKIEIEYPILDVTNEKSMKISITKFWGDNVNDVGNFTMAGHNNIDNTMFGKIDKLEVGDVIKMTDLSGNIIEYEVFSQYIIDPNDVTCVNSVEPDKREITLITCKNGRSKRLITKARECKI